MAFQLPQYKNQYNDDWGRLAQFGNTSGYLDAPEMSYDSGGTTSLGGPGLLNSVDNTVGTDPGMMSRFGNWFKNSGFTGSTDTKTGIKTDGWGGMALGVAQGLGSAYMGLKQYGLAKDQLAFQKSAYNKNYAAQRQSTNTDLADRQAARVAANSSYESVGSYMNKNRIA